MTKEQLHVVGISGGKDSTALGLRLAETFSGPLLFLITPTGDELPDMVAHWARLKTLVEGMGHSWQAVFHPGGNLHQLSIKQRMLPSTRARWCTRMLKIVPYSGYLQSLRAKSAQRGVELEIHSYVGLRADEPERVGMYGEGLIYHFPLREWGWTLQDVRCYLDSKGIEIPQRTDCGSCPFQRLYEWYNTYKRFPEQFEAAVQLEASVSDEVGRPCTIRNPTRDSWPTGLRELRQEFRELDKFLEKVPVEGLQANELLEVARDMPGEVEQNVKRLRMWRSLLRAAIKGAAPNSEACRVCTM